MTATYTRQFTTARQQQGFKSQAHLDAFYAAYDHTTHCHECQQRGAGVLLDDGYQPTLRRCPEARHLEAASHAF